MTGDYRVSGRNAAAPFSLTLHRGEGMVLLAMNWRTDRPPNDFAGFAIEYREPDGDRFFAVSNRLTFPPAQGSSARRSLRSLDSPIQKFRWVHFPRNAERAGSFLYRVTPVFMNTAGELSYGDAQEAAIALQRETYPGKANVTFTRGFVSSQAFVDRYHQHGDISTLLPAKADDGLDFKPTHPKADEALAWMGFEARHALLEVLDEAVVSDAQVRVVAYDLCEPDIVTRLEALGRRLTVIIDDSGKHAEPHSAESRAAARLAISAGPDRVLRQSMKKLQHNKTIIVDRPGLKRVVCGSTNFTWRGLFVQSNNAVVLTGDGPVGAFNTAFDAYWSREATFGASPAAEWIDLRIQGLDAKVTFSPHDPANRVLADIGRDIGAARSSVFYSLAFLYQTRGAIREAIEDVTNADDIFVYGVSDRASGLDLQKPNGNRAPVYPAALSGDVPEPFKSEPSGLAGGVGNRMHHKFVVIDFDKPSARVYFGSYNFSGAADDSNGENLLLIRDRRIATAYMVEALRIFDHYHFRVAVKEARRTGGRLALRRPPANASETPWWRDDYEVPHKIRDRLLFA